MTKPSSPSLAVALTAQTVTARIVTLRGVQVLLDSHLAEMYAVETKSLNRAVKRNTARFPEAFCFQLTPAEWAELRPQGTPSTSADSLRFQSGTLKPPARGQHRKYLPFAFTEQGVAMLSAVLHSDTAVEVSIRIINAFVEMRKLLVHQAHLLQKVERIEARQLQHITASDQKFEQIFTALESHGSAPPPQGIFFEGQIFDAYAFASDLIRQAKKSIVLVDNYVDDSVLLLLSKRRPAVSATIYTKKINAQLALDLQKHQAQYPAIEVKPVAGFHDRFLLLDGDTLYHLGASLKDLGKQCFAFSRLDSFAAELRQQLTPSD
jgi:phage regulator Rha-like protein